MLMHEIGARCSISSPDLSKMLCDQIGACSAVLVVPDRPCVISLLVVIGFLDLLLEPELFKNLMLIRLGCLRAKRAPMMIS